MPSQQESTTTKYLSHYGELESKQLHDFPSGFKQGLVIPIYQEDPLAIARLRKFARHNQGTLLILVINRPDNDNNQQWAVPFFKHCNKAFWQSTDQVLTLVSIESAKEKYQSNSAILLVDRCIKGKALPKKQGVGLARKIGADILCRLIDNKKVQSPWIFNTDADTHLPLDYFSTTHINDTSIAAIIYPFEHCFTNSDLTKLPTLLYEFSLHYYVEGLRYAGSPYAYHTLGSTIAVNYLHYVKVRGFPKRAAAEDFYLLNKLAKTGIIISLTKPIVHIIARESTRVPFGTGPAVINLAAKSNILMMALYHPHCFDYLSIFIKLLDELSDQENNISIQENIENAVKNHCTTQLDSQLLFNIAKDFNLADALAHSFRHGKKKSTRVQHLHNWFDSFKTLKFIHYLRDNGLGTITFQHWLTEYTYPCTLDTQEAKPAFSALIEELTNHCNINTDKLKTSKSLFSRSRTGYNNT